MNYSEVLRGTAALAGMGAADIGTAEFALLRGFHDRRLQQAWELHEWPELCRVEQRYYRPWWDAAYAAATNYGAGDERYDAATGGYYQSLVDSNTAAPTVAGVENSAYWAACAASYAASDWVTATAYAVGNQVRNALDNVYYQCISAHTAGATFAGDAANWGALAAFDRYIGLEQVEDDGTARTVIGEALRLWDQSPRLTTRLTEYSFWLSENGIQAGPEAPAAVWVEFRLRRPVLTGDAWSSATAYSTGDQVYYAGSTGLGTGNFYEALRSTTGDVPTTSASDWELVEVPYAFRGWLIQAGYADWLTSDGQADKGALAERQALDWLELEADKVQRQQGQVRRLRWQG